MEKRGMQKGTNMFHNLPDYILFDELNKMERQSRIPQDDDQLYLYLLEEELESRIPQDDNQLYLGEYGGKILIISQPRK